MRIEIQTVLYKIMKDNFDKFIILNISGILTLVYLCACVHVQHLKLDQLLPKVES